MDLEKFSAKIQTTKELYRILNGNFDEIKKMIASIIEHITELEKTVNEKEDEIEALFKED